MKELLFLLLFAPAAFGQMRPVNTFSVVARDPRTGEMGWRGGGRFFRTVD